MAYFTVAQCQAKLDYYYALTIRGRDVMDALGNRITELSPTDVHGAIDYWERKLSAATAAANGTRGAIVLARRASE